MESKRPFRDDLLTSLVAFGTGLVAGLAVSFPVGWLTFVLVETDCSGEWLCGLGALIWAALVGCVCGVVAFAVAATKTLFKQCPTGERLRAGLLTFLGVPLFLVLLFSTAGLA